LIVSLPAAPLMTSSPGVPLIVSLAAVPGIVTVSPKHGLDAAAGTAEIAIVVSTPAAAIRTLRLPNA
jgi:hypothetical protein